jgi:GntR family histidine utilization transcriptional repressor
LLKDMPESNLRLPKRAEKAPLYQQVKEAVIGQILSGAWREGTRVPSENDMVRSLAISRMTAHRALRELTAEGWLNRLRGVGTFVAEAKPQSAVMEIRSIKAEIEARGQQHQAEVHLLQRERARALEAGLLDLKARQTIFHSVTLHRENGVAIQLEERFVNPQLVPDYLKQDFTQVPPNDYLMSVAPTSRSEHTILAVIPTPWQKKLLEMKAGEPCLLLRQRCWWAERPVTWVQLFHPGKHYRLGSQSHGPGGGFNIA